MLAVTFERHGPPDVLELIEVADPVPTPDQVVIEVLAAGVNRADLLQRDGQYTRPLDDLETRLGLEVSGHIAEIGDRVTGFEVGDPVCALLPGGGYAERVAAHYRLVIPAPPAPSLEDLAAIPEAFITAFDALVLQGGTTMGMHVLIHAAASGVGTAAIQLVSTLGAMSAATCSSSKVAKVLELGADLGIDRLHEDFEPRVRKWNEEGIDLILDPVGGDYLMRNLRLLKPQGTLIILSAIGGSIAEIDLNLLQKKRLTVIGSALRPRPLEQRAWAVQEFIGRCLPVIAAGKMRPVVDRRFSFDEVGEAHSYVEANRNVGKVILVW